MRIPDPLLQELRLLAQFDPATALAGIKVHHEAENVLIDAARRLFDKGMISQPDGGYLTIRGQEAVIHLDNVLSLLDCEIPQPMQPSA